MSRSSGGGDARFGVEWLASQLKLPKDLWCLRVIAERGLEVKTEEAIASFMDLLDHQPLSPPLKRGLKKSFLSALEQRFRVEKILLAHIRACIGLDEFRVNTAHHHAAEAENLAEKLDRHGAGPRLKHERLEKRHKAMDEGWRAGFRDEAGLFNFMKQNYHDLVWIRKRRDFMSSRHIWASYQRYRRQRDRSEAQ
jgi:hypothetical protein